jgi:G3E family GTPase
MEKTKLIFAGGFLGAGKTTLLWKAAQQAMRQGLNVGLITNDQAPELVDSALLACEGLKVAEVSGSCFCCNFNGFADAAKHLRSNVAAGVIIAEPVGSCTDLSATILQPLKKYLKHDFEAAPLTTLADPARLRDILDGGKAGLHSDAAYIYRKQLEESDVILITKADCYASGVIEALKQRTAKAFPFATVMAASALSGEGVEEWFNEVFNRSDAGKRLAAVDYDTYARGEAVLGWLNGTLRLSGRATNWNIFVEKYLRALSAQLEGDSCPVGHVKIIAENNNQFIVGNLTGKADTLMLRGAIDTCDDIKLIINARVETSPEKLDQIVNNVFESTVAGKYSYQKTAWRCLSPGRPNPTYRFTETIQTSNS